MQDILKKILSFSLCVVYVLASCGFVRHDCSRNGVAYVLPLVNNECSYCAEHKCCHHCEQQKQNKDEKSCCEETFETISSDQYQSNSNDISAPTCSTIIAIVYDDTDLICSAFAKPVEIYPPPFNYKTPLIYHTGQLRV